MSDIKGIGGPAMRGVPNRTTSSRATGFAVHADLSNTSHCSQAGETQPASLASILMLQELGSETEADRQARRHGHDMLAALSELQRAILGATGGGEALERLGELAASVPLATDRRLAALISAIIVRVRVELARHQA